MGLFNLFSGQPASPGTSAPPQGLLDMILGQSNPVSQFADSRQNVLGAIGAGLASGPTFSQGMANAAQNVPQARKADYQMGLYRGQVSQTVKYLQDKHPDLAQAVQSGTLSPSDAFNMAFAQDNRAGVSVAPGSSFVDPITGQPKGPGGDPSMAGGAAVGQPYQGTDANGKPAMLISTSFGAPRVLGPIGGDANAGASGMTIQDPNVNLKNNAISTAQGVTQAAAQAQLPAMSQSVALTNQAIQLIKTDKAGLDETFGKVAGAIPQQWIPGAVPGTAKARFQTNLAQATGQTFLQARQALKGGGSITDYEGNKAESAYARMSTATDKESFLKAVDDFQTATNAGYAKLRAVAAGTYDPNNDYGMGSQTANYKAASSADTGAPPITATNPQTGQKIVLQNGQWVPAQ